MNETEQKMSTTYYIDFENVHNDGLEGIRQLEEGEQVLVFYSKKANTMAIDQVIEVLASKADVTFVKIDNGTPNALDFQLTTMLIANLSAERDHVIVSADTGYDAVIKMARRMGLPSITRRPRISERQAAKALSDTCENSSPGKMPPESKLDAAPSCKPNASSAHAGIATRDMSSEDVEKQPITDAEAERLGTGQASGSPAEELEGQPDQGESGVPIVPFQPIAAKPKSMKRRDLVSQALADAGVSLKQQQLSAVMNALNSTHRKQDFYIHIIKSEGQQRGLSLYRRVRDHYDKMAALVRS